MQITPIGTVYSCFKEKFGTPRQGNLVPKTSGYIEFDKSWDPHKSLIGLEEFSHAWILFWFHENKNFSFKPMVTPPRSQERRLGTFATRSPMRPNPIGLSLVKIESVKAPYVYISGLDIIESTPVIDIKPYIHQYDSAVDSKEGWLAELKSEPMPVLFSSEALQTAELQSNSQLISTLEMILQADIRNRNDKREKNEGKILGFYYCDFNIVFQVKNNQAHVLRIEKRKKEPFS